MVMQRKPKPPTGRRATGKKPEIAKILDKRTKSVVNAAKREGETDMGTKSSRKR